MTIEQAVRKFAFQPFPFWRFGKMPRMSAEARGAVSYRSGSRPPPPPKDLSPEAAKLWRAIVRAKPIGWFDAGSLPLLARYCRTAVRAERLADALDLIGVHDL